MERMQITMVIFLVITGSQIQAMSSRVSGSAARRAGQATKTLGRTAEEEVGATAGQEVAGRGVARRAVQPMPRRSNTIVPEQQLTPGKRTGLDTSSVNYRPVGARAFHTNAPVMTIEGDSPSLTDAYKQEEKPGVVTRALMTEKPWDKMTMQEKIINLESRIEELSKVDDGIRYKQPIDEFKEQFLHVSNAKVTKELLQDIEDLQSHVRIIERQLGVWPKPGSPIGFDYYYLDLGSDVRSRVLKNKSLNEKVEYLIEKVNELPLDDKERDDLYEKIYTWKKNVEKGAFKRMGFDYRDREREAFDDIHNFIHNHWFFIKLQNFIPHPEGARRPSWEQTTKGWYGSYEQKDLSGIKAGNQSTGQDITDYNQLTGQDILDLDDLVLRRLLADDPAAFNNLAKKFHPDVNPDPNATAVMQKIVGAKK